MRLSRLVAAAGLALTLTQCETDPSEQSNQPTQAEIAWGNKQITENLRAALKTSIDTLFQKEDLSLQDVCQISSGIEALIMRVLTETYWQTVPAAEPLIVVYPDGTAQHTFSQVLTPQYLGKADGEQAMTTQVHLFTDPLQKPDFISHTVSFVLNDGSLIEVMVSQNPQQEYYFRHFYMREATGQTVGISTAIPFDIETGSAGARPVVLLGADELPDLGGECGITKDQYLESQAMWLATTAGLAAKFPQE